MSAFLTVVLLCVLVAGIVAGLQWAGNDSQAQSVSKLPPEQRAKWNELRDAERLLKSEERAYESRVRAAEKALRNAQRIPKIAAITLKAPDTLKGAFRGDQRFELHADRLKTPDGERPLTPAVTATVDSAGNLSSSVKSRSTLTRMAGGTLVAGPVGLLAGGMLKKHRNVTADSRELYLLIDGGDWAAMVQCHPDQGAKVRDFVQKLNIAARNSDHARQMHTDTVNRLEAELTEAVHNTDARAQARTRVAELQREAPQLSVG